MHWYFETPDLTDIADPMRVTRFILSVHRERKGKNL